MFFFKTNNLLNTNNKRFLFATLCRNGNFFEKVDYLQHMPPSMGRRTPLMNLESGPQRKAAAPATSAGVGKGISAFANIGLKSNDDSRSFSPI